jgi:hypothetical protein
MMKLHIMINLLNSLYSLLKIEECFTFLSYLLTLKTFHILYLQISSQVKFFFSLMQLVNRESWHCCSNQIFMNRWAQQCNSLCHRLVVNLTLNTPCTQWLIMSLKGLLNLQLKKSYIGLLKLINFLNDSIGFPFSNESIRFPLRIFTCSYQDN